MNDFYHQVVDGLLARGTLDRSMSILVACGGEQDKRALERLGFSDVTISNLDQRSGKDVYHPYKWSHQDAEQLTFGDATFDFCIVHSGLHHCHSPHRGLLELYRVARQGVLMFEPYDNVLTRIGAKLGLGQEHEHAAVYFDEKGFGGVRNGPIPNYVYRFTRRELRKTLQSYEPLGWHRIEFIHALRVPWVQLRGRKNKLYLAAVLSAYPLAAVLARVFPSACNNFAAVILKLGPRDRLHPWLRTTASGVVVDDAWLEARYRGGATYGRGA